jgi:F420-dependent oxidoreductase-like protein
LTALPLRVFTEPQYGATYDQLLAAARVTQECGFDAFFRSDHYLRTGGEIAGSGHPGPTDAWATLAGLAVQTSRIRLGTMMSAATFRLPGPLAVTVAQVDAMSGGRVELGLGAGWYEAEHAAFGIPFPPLAQRFEMLAEQLAVISGLWTTPPGEPFSFDGTHYRLRENPALARPVQSPRPPLLVGGHGGTKTPALAARFADEFNVALSLPSECEEAFGRVRRACEAVGRDPDGIICSAALVLCVGSTQAEFARRAARIGEDPARLRRAAAIAGTPAEAVDRIGEWVKAGTQRVYLQLLDITDLDQLRLVAQEVAPHFS